MIVIAILTGAAAPTDFGVRELSGSRPVSIKSRSHFGDHASAQSFQCTVRSVTDCTVHWNEGAETWLPE